MSFLEWCLTAWEACSTFPYAILLKEDNRFIGMIEIGFEGRRAEIGFASAKRYWGKGYMTELAQAIVDWAFSQDCVFRVSAFCDLENRASARVLEKIGMQKEGVFRLYVMHSNLSAEPRDVCVFAKGR